MKQYSVPDTYNSDEENIWNVLINNDFRAFCSGDWSMIQNDFIENGFYGIQANKSNNKSVWELQYDSLESYKEDWINQSNEFNKLDFTVDPLEVLFETTKLSKIEIKDNSALVHKEFEGEFLVKHAKSIKLDWISMFLMRKNNNEWKISSFVGYMPK